MLRLPSSLERVTNELARLPGIGPKTAQRLALFLLKRDEFENQEMAKAVSEISTNVQICEQCFIMSDHNPCAICSDDSRDTSVICVVEEPLDAIALEKTGSYKGLFHILGGVLNPLEGIGPKELTIEQLLERLSKNEIKEVIIATNPTLEGETTAMHLNKLLSGKDLNITRIARGLPMGGDMEYADEITLSRALDGRRQI